MAELVRSRTEIECLISDFNLASQNGEQKRKQTAKELETLEKRMEEVTSRMAVLGSELDERVAEERKAREALVKPLSPLFVH